MKDITDEKADQFIDQLKFARAIGAVPGQDVLAEISQKYPKLLGTFATFFMGEDYARLQLSEEQCMGLLVWFAYTIKLLEEENQEDFSDK